MKKSKARTADLRIETLRGIAILAVVAHHVAIWMLAETKRSGVDPGIVNSALQFGSDFLKPVRMPLFTIISGWVYALFPVSKSNILPFGLAKIRRIIIPLFFVSTCTYFLTGLISGQYPGIVGQSPQEIPPSSFYVMWFYHFGHLWFLQAITLLFVFIATVDSLKLMEKLSHWFAWLTFATLFYYLFPDHIEFWSMSKLKSIFPFFVFGVGLCRFKDTIFNSPLVICAGPILLISLFLKQIGEPGIFMKFSIYTLIVGTLSPIFFYSIGVIFQPFIWLAKYSYTIYLYHGIAFVLLMPICSKLMINELQWLWAVLFLLGGITFPILLENYGKKLPYLRTLILGKKS